MCVCALVPTTGWAQQARSTVVLQIEGGAEHADKAETLTAIVRNEAQQTLDFAVVNKRPINLSEVMLLLGCSERDNACLRQVASQVEARVLVYGSMSREGAGHRLVIEIYDDDERKVTHRLQRVLASDGDLIVDYRREVEVFFKEIKREASGATLNITSNVRGARVRLNGEDVGHTPLERVGLGPGQYTVEVDSEGFSDWSMVVALTEGATLDLRAPLKRETVAAKDPDATDTDTGDTTTGDGTSPVLDLPDVEDPRSPSDKVGTGNVGGWVVVGLGGGALVGSVVTGFMMERVEDELLQKFESGTLTGAERDDLIARGERLELSHRIMLGAGVGAVLIGGLWLLLDVDDSDANAVRIAPTLNGVQATYTW